MGNGNQKRPLGGIKIQLPGKPGAAAAMEPWGAAGKGSSRQTQRHDPVSEAMGRSRLAPGAWHTAGADLRSLQIPGSGCWAPGHLCGRLLPHAVLRVEPWVLTLIPTQACSGIHLGRARHAYPSCKEPTLHSSKLQTHELLGPAKVHASSWSINSKQVAFLGQCLHGAWSPAFSPQSLVTPKPPCREIHHEQQPWPVWFSG